MTAGEKIPQEKDKVKRCVIITGLSGAGKTAALNILEDQGFFAVDNLPPPLMPQLMEVLSGNNAATTHGVAVVIDIRGEDLFEELFFSIEQLKETIADVKVLFLEASDDWLVRRYETTRRRHPLGKGLTILESVAKERLRLAVIRAVADVTMDTSSLLPSDLRGYILSELGINDDPPTVIISSFGFKNGIPKDCDYMFDVRFLPNPNYVPALKSLSGKDAPVQKYLEKIPEKRIFMERLESLLELILMQYDSTGKRQFHVAVGCTGGRHRSVAIAEQLAQYLSGRGHKVVLNHRDIDLDTKR